MMRIIIPYSTTYPYRPLASDKKSRHQAGQNPKKNLATPKLPSRQLSFSQPPRNEPKLR
ncbi:hypothetical protein PQR63_04735 [Herbaspirillum rhizosphaerae]|uniref:Uncharacterized protein n=1 Tax=Herbaspirillum rhizosphaerae TaxID=346179 RepID=A0ABW8Z5D2_9BURK